MYRILLTYTFIAAFTTKALAQDMIQKPERYLSFSIGLTHLSLQDNLLSPLVYRGSGSVIGFVFASQNEKGYSETLWNSSKQSLSPTLNPLSRTRVENQLLNLNYEYLRRLKSGKYNHELGLGLYNHLSVRTYDFRVGDEIAVDFFSSLNLIYSLYTVIKEKHNLRLKLSYPMVAYAVHDGSVNLSQATFEELLEDTEARPSFGKLLKAGDFQSVNHFSDLRFTANYFFDFSAHFAVGVQYLFQIPGYIESRKANMGISQYIFKAAFKF